MYKIGITNRTVKERYGTRKYKEIDVIYKKYFGLGHDAKKLEKKLLEEFAEYRVKNENFDDVYGGLTEFFSIDIFSKTKEVTNV